MTWIDLKVRKPTEADADENGEVLWRMTKNGAVSWPWDDTKDAVAWMPIPDFVPLPKTPDGYRIIDPATEPFNAEALWYSRNGRMWVPALGTEVYNPDLVYAAPVSPPEPPDGYEILTDYDAEPDPKARYWHAGNQEWYFRPPGAYIQNMTYAVPIAPPEPQYRPFANAAEFRPFQHLWWKIKGDSRHCPPRAYDDAGNLNTWQYMFDKCEFQDGQPFGVKVGGDE